MDEALQADFQRVESALETLVDSIAAYNPSTSAAADLLAADDHLSRGLDQLARHQANYARIQSLRAEAEALEDQLRTSVSTLASLRRELFETPATTFSKDSRSVPVSDLLQYAKNISQFTVPPTYRERIATPPAEDTKAGTDTPAIAPTTAASATATQEDAEPERAEPDVTVEEAEWLKKLNESNTPWTPWPSDEKIRGSNLMQIQYLIDTGKDPKQVDLTKLPEEEREEMAANAQRAADQAAGVDLHEMQSHSAPRPQAPRAPADTFKGFEFLEDDDDD